MKTKTSQMKKIIAGLCCLLAFSFYTQAQHCASATNSVPPHAATGTPGFIPGFYAMPCIDSGTYVSDTLYFENYTSITDSNTTLAVNSLTIDSIENLPSGLCWTTNVANNQFAGAQTGVIVISGTTRAFSGQYKLRFIVDINAGAAGAVNLVRQDADRLAAYLPVPLRYYLRVHQPGSSCPNVDTTQGGVTVLLTASVSASSHTICTSTPVTLTANSCTGCTYVWSNAATGQSIQVSSAGSYTVTITQNSTTAASTPITIGADNPLVARFNLYQDTTTSNLWHTDNTSIGTGVTFYQWTWGDGYGSGDTIYSPSHVYTAQGVFTVCLQIYDSVGCMATHCDSTNQTTVPLPATATINPSSQVVCNGAPVTLTASFCSGCTYSWSNFASGQSISVTGAGPYTVTISDGTHSVTSAPVSLRIDTIHVRYTLTQDTNNSSIWYGTNSSTGTYGITWAYWTWGDGYGSVDTTFGASHQYTTSGAHTVCLQAYDSVGCTAIHCDSSGYTNIPLPSIATITESAATICNSSAVTLTADFCSGCTYLWSNSATGQSINVTSAGSYTVTISDGVNSVASAPLTLTASNVVASFSLSPDTNQAHHWFVTNNCSGSGALSYIWSWGDGSGDSTANPAHSYAAAGYYNICVRVWDAAGCYASFCDSNSYLYRSQGFISVQVIPGTASGITDISADASAKVYPNPAASALTIETAGSGAQTGLIYDALGRAMREVSLTSPKTNLNLSGLSDGVYIISFPHSNTPSVRFVIAR
jgi:hypothetical protein